MTDWHILTGEYPPQPGGVSDYTRRIARGLAAAGDRVNVWAPPARDAEHNGDGVTIQRLPDCFGPRSLRHLTRELDRLPAPRRLLVQYVPHAFGWKAANVPFCLWLKARRRDSIWVMFHEVAFPFDREQSMTRNALAAINRMMASMVAASAERAFVSIPGWQPAVQSMIGPGKPVEWLPVPSSIPVVARRDAVATVRAQYAGAHPLVGHFGTHGAAIRQMLAASIPALLDGSDHRVLLIGPRSHDVRRDLLEAHSSFDGRIHAAGVLADEAVSVHVAACDVMLQPYPDGISSRRTSAMVALSHGVPTVTTSGWLTEALWETSGAVVLVPADEPAALAAATARLIASPSDRAAIGARARELYASRFDLLHSINALRATDALQTSDFRLQTS